MNLIKFIFTWEQWVKGQYFEEDTSNSPDIHFVSIMTISHQTLWSTVPSSGNILCERWLIV
jgi:hypothetical protein